MKLMEEECFQKYLDGYNWTSNLNISILVLKQSNYIVFQKGAYFVLKSNSFALIKTWLNLIFSVDSDYRMRMS